MIEAWNSDLEMILAQLCFVNVKKDKRNLDVNIYFPEKNLTNVFIETLLYFAFVFKL